MPGTVPFLLLLAAATLLVRRFRDRSGGAMLRLGIGLIFARRSGA